jgi:hypothetical protein
MLKFFKIAYALGFFLMFMGCASTNSPRYLKNGKVVTGDYSQYQKSYSLKIPDNWSGYFDTHSQFCYKPKKAIEENLYIKVHIMDENTLKVDDNITNLESFTNDLVDNIKERDTNLGFTVVYNEHSIYKKYSIVNSREYILGDKYTILEVSFYYNSKPFRISYFAQTDQFPNYLDDFTSMLETFRIKE